MNSNYHVSLIGLGHMGSALAESLLDSDFDVTVWNRTRSRSAQIEDRGATVAPSVARAADNTDVMVVCLLDHEATRDTVMNDEVGAALQGKALVQLSTTLEQEVEELAAWAGARDISFLKGSIMVYPDDIRADCGEILYGGPEPLFSALSPVLTAMGGRPMRVCDQPAETVAHTSAAYSFLYAGLISALYGAAICHRSGTSVEAFTNNVLDPFVSGGSLMRYIKNASRAAADRSYDGELQATLDVWNDALRQVMIDIRARGIDTDVLNPLKDLMDRAASRGHGQCDLASVVEVLLEGNAATESETSDS